MQWHARQRWCGPGRIFDSPISTNRLHSSRFTGQSHPSSRILILIRGFGLSVGFAVNRSLYPLLGTDLYVWGNDWRNGLVDYTIDGEPVFDHLIDLHTTDSTAGRCRFTWFTKTGLAPTTHTFQFNLTGPSLGLINTTQGYLSGTAANLGLQFFYYTYVTNCSAFRLGLKPSTPATPRFHITLLIRGQLLEAVWVVRLVVCSSSHFSSGWCFDGDANETPERI
jgi:hypothetical protein